MSDSTNDPTKDPRRMLRGLKIHRDEEWDYSFWRPTQWNRFDMRDQYGFIYSPEEDPRSGFYFAVADLSEELDEPVAEKDLPALREGLMDGLRGLQDCEILSEKEISKEEAIGFEVMLTFALDGEQCKRLMRLLYNDRHQYTIYGQGVPVHEYEVFHDTYEFMYSSFTFGDLRDKLGVPVPPGSTITWSGGGKDVRTFPRRQRRSGG